MNLSTMRKKYGSGFAALWMPGGGRAAFQKRLSGQVPQHRNRRRFADFETNARPRRNNQPLSARHVQMGDAWHAAVL